MQISQLNPAQVNQFGSVHAIHHGLSEGNQLVLLSGVVSVDLQSPGWANENAVTGWFKEKLSLEIGLPAGLLSAGQHFRMVQAVPYLSINAVAGVSNVGWAVNSFALALDEAATQSVRLDAALAVSRSGEILHRVAYHITVIGQVVG